MSDFYDMVMGKCHVVTYQTMATNFKTLDDFCKGDLDVALDVLDVCIASNYQNIQWGIQSYNRDKTGNKFNQSVNTKLTAAIHNDDVHFESGNEWDYNKILRSRNKAGDTSEYPSTFDSWCRYFKTNDEQMYESYRSERYYGELDASGFSEIMAKHPEFTSYINNDELKSLLFDSNINSVYEHIKNNS